MKTTHSKYRASIAAYLVLTIIGAAAASVLYGLVRIGCWLFELSMPSL